MSANVESMAYANETPWHGLGNRVDETVTTDEMLIAAGLNWEVGLAPVRFYTSGRPPRQLTSEAHNVMYRMDTDAVLDIVGPRYVPVQNHEILEFFREYVEAGDMRLETAGSLNGGKQVWALAKMDDAFELAGGDRVEGYVLLANPHLYGRGMVAKFTSVRVVCHNTYTQALAAGSSGEIKLWHHRAFNEDMRREAKRRLGIARERLDAFAEVAESLAKLSLDRETVATVAARVFGVDEDRKLEDQTPTVKRIVTLWEGEGMGADLEAAAGTAWGAFGAFTQFQDWEQGRSQDARISSAWFGRGEVMKRRALEELLALTK